MPISEAVTFFEAVPPIARHLTTLVSVGLGYVRLGRPATTLSGGEAQRVKLASELHKRSTGRTVYVLDEPTTGLHFEDVRRLLEVLHWLVYKATQLSSLNTTLMSSRHQTGSLTLDLSAGSGPGGRIIATGTPEDVAANHLKTGSFTGEYLAQVLERTGIAKPTPARASGTARTEAKASASARARAKA
jgi:excinuclease ABC subunit A